MRRPHVLVRSHLVPRCASLVLRLVSFFDDDIIDRRAAGAGFVLALGALGGFFSLALAPGLFTLTLDD